MLQNEPTSQNLLISLSINAREIALIWKIDVRWTLEQIPASLRHTQSTDSTLTVIAANGNN